jgi:quercetin dioxygenase-like cupin family protein
MRKSYWLIDTRLSVLASAAETGGRYDLVEGWFPAGVRVPPHRHGRYSEHLYALGGEFTVWAGDRKSVLRPGDDLAIPAGTAHTLTVTGDEPGRALVFTLPTGFARLIIEAGTPAETGEAPTPTAADMDLLLRLSAELGDEILGPPGALLTNPKKADLEASPRVLSASRFTSRGVMRWGPKKHCRASGTSM